MSFTSMTTRAAGYVVKAATDWNVMIANFAALWVGTTAGDIDYYDSATSKTRIAIGAADTFVKTSGTVPAWGPLVKRRQGGSSTIWTSAGTTSYTPTATVIQIGVISIVVSSGGTNSAAITYPVAFAQRPSIFLSSENTGGLATVWTVGYTDDTVNGFNLHLKFVSTSQTGTYNCGWLAIGQ
jgi:hypothetical protein